MTRIWTVIEVSNGFVVRENERMFSTGEEVLPRESSHVFRSAEELADFFAENSRVG